MNQLARYALLIAAAAGTVLVASLLTSPPTWLVPVPTATPALEPPRVMAAPRAAETPRQTSTPAAVGPVVAIGDSIMLSAAADLKSAIKDITIDAEVGRQVPAALDILGRRRAAGTLAPVMVIHMGTNGTFTAQQFDAMMEMLAGARRVIFVNVRAPLPWEKPDNEMLAAAVPRYPRAVLVDWYGATANRPELFWDDGVHLRPDGARLFASLVSQAVHAP